MNAFNVESDFSFSTHYAVFRERFAQYLISPRIARAFAVTLAVACVGKLDRSVASTPEQEAVAISRMNELVDRAPELNGSIPGTIKVKERDANGSVTDIEIYRGTDDSLEPLRMLSHLRRLDLRSSWVGVTDVGLKYIAGLTQLEELYLPNKSTDAGMENLKSLSNLRKLSVSARVTDEGLRNLSGLTKLETLSLAFDDKVTDGGLKHIAALTNLRQLNLEGTSVTGIGLSNLKDLAQLNCLYIEHAPVTDTGLRSLADLAQLCDLNLQGTKITDAGLVYLKPLQHLRKLRISDTKVTGTGWEHIGGLVQLEELDLGEAKAAAANTKYLKNLKNLRILRLTGCDLTDVSLKNIAGLTELCELSLACNEKISDAGLVHLESLTKLRKLDLNDDAVEDGGNITAAGIKRLRNALPNLNIKCEINRGSR